MPNNDVGTNPFYVSSISLLPTIDFLEYVAKKQWDSDVSYGLGISTIVPMFHSTTNSEWLCLNSESEFLESPKGTISIKNPFAYTRPESSPVYVGYNDISIPSAKANKAKSLYLFRIDEDGKNEVIMVSNYDKKPDNVTSAPPLSQVASKYPRALVYKYYNSLAKEYGMPIRSAIAVSHKLWSMGQETSANGFLTVKQTAIGLGFTQTKIIGFISDGLAVEKENKIYYIKQEDLINFLIECPEKMIGIPESGFMWFMKVLKEVRDGDRNANNN